MGLFGKKKQLQLDQQPISTLLSDSCTIDGNFRASAFARIDGVVNGDVSVDEGLILGEKGVVKGNVTTKELIVYGVINGDIQTTSVELKSTCKVYGAIKTQSLKVDTGGIYTGHLFMDQANQAE